MKYSFENWYVPVLYSFKSIDEQVKKITIKRDNRLANIYTPIGAFISSLIVQSETKLNHRVHAAAASGSSSIAGKVIRYTIEDILGFDGLKDVLEGTQEVLNAQKEILNLFDKIETDFSSVSHLEQEVAFWIGFLHSNEDIQKRHKLIIKKITHDNILNKTTLSRFVENLADNMDIILEYGGENKITYAVGTIKRIRHNEYWLINKLFKFTYDIDSHTESGLWNLVIDMINTFPERPKRIPDLSSLKIH